MECPRRVAICKPSLSVLVAIEPGSSHIINWDLDDLRKYIIWSQRF
jgi:hypothetical protein